MYPLRLNFATLLPIVYHFKQQKKRGRETFLFPFAPLLHRFCTELLFYIINGYVGANLRLILGIVGYCDGTVFDSC